MTDKKDVKQKQFENVSTSKECPVLNYTAQIVI